MSPGALTFTIAVAAGLVVAAVVGTWNYLGRRKQIGPAAEAKAELTDGGMARMKLLPDEIAEQVYEAPPLQRAERAQHFVGAQIRWTLVYVSAFEIPGEPSMIALIMKQEQKVSLASVSTEVSLDEFPELKSLRAASKITVLGRIESIDVLEIRLAECTLEFEVTR